MKEEWNWSIRKSSSMTPSVVFKGVEFYFDLVSAQNVVSCTVIILSARGIRPTPEDPALIKSSTRFDLLIYY